MEKGFYCQNCETTTETIYPTTTLLITKKAEKNRSTDFC